VCSECPRGTFNEGPLPRAVGPGAAATGSPAAQGGSSSSTGSSGASRSARSISRNANKGSWKTRSRVQDSNPDVVLLDTADEGYTDEEEDESMPQVTAYSAGMTDYPSSVSIAAAAAGITPQQTPDSWSFLRSSGVNPVFYEPTYNPCTPCGTSCFTDRPGAFSAGQCSKYYEAVQHST